MSYALVFWIQENRYSTVKFKKVKCGPTISQDDIVGKTFPVIWKKGICYDGEIKAVGTSVEMKEQEEFWEKVAMDASFSLNEVRDASDPGEPSQQQQKRKTRARSDDEFTFRMVDETDESQPVEPDINTAADGDGIDQPGTTSTDEDKNEISKLRDLLRQRDKTIRDRDLELINERAKNRTLRRQALKRSVPVDGEDEMVNIGGASIPKCVDDFLKASYTGQPSLFIRHLVFKSGLFTLEEVATSSLTGVRSSQSPQEARPALKPAIFKILKNYTITSCGLKPGTLEMLQFEQRIRSICTDARRKLKQTED